MQKRVRIVLVVLVAIGLWWWFMPPDHEKILRERMQEIVQILEKEGEEHVVNMTLRMNRLKEYLAPTVSLEIAGRTGKFSELREALIAQAVLLRGRYHWIRGRVEVENVLVMEGNREAWMTAEGTFRLGKMGQDTEYKARYRLYWVRPEKEWQLVSTAIVSMDRVVAPAVEAAQQHAAPVR